MKQVDSMECSSTASQRTEEPHGQKPKLSN
nr:MAG TPA: hypothetical protein [Caudoviricetes sp.]